MAQNRTAYYEGMFLISQAVATDLAGVTAFIRQTIEKNGGTVIAMRKWDERRLAFEIQKQKRGYYILTYFQAPTSALTTMERSFNLSEQIMRQLVTKVEHLTVAEMQAADAQRDLETEAKLRATQPASVVMAAAVNEIERPEEPEADEE